MRTLQIMLAGLLLLGLQTAQAQEQCLGSQNQLSGGGTNDHWELWNPVNDADNCITPGTGARFSGRWDNADDYLARRGVYYGANAAGQTWRQRGGLKFAYTVDWRPQFVTGGNSSVGLYGWVHRANNTGATAEFYIIENWYQWNHAQDGTAQVLGTMAVNGVVYDVIKTTRNNQPTPWGNQNFSQYVSIRKDRGTNNQSPSPAGVISGTINVGQHFAAWEKFGLDMSGELYEVAFLAEGYKSTGTVNVTQLDITTVPAPTSVATDLSTYTLNDTGTEWGSLVAWSCLPTTYDCRDVSVVLTNGTSGTSFCQNATVAVSPYHGRWFISGLGTGTCTLHMVSPDGTRSGTATLNSTGLVSMGKVVEYRAAGNKGGEQIFLVHDGARLKSRTLSTAFQTFRDTVYGEGEIGIEFANDDAVANGKAARVDYLSVDGLKRETEAQAVNTGSYANGRCGGGSNSEWLYCNGAVSYGPLKQDHTIRIRARGNAGGEHIHLLINGVSVNTGWWLTTAFQEFSVNVVGDGDINIRYDNDGGTRDVVVDWVKVDAQNPRQAENMQYNTGAYLNGRCGGGSFSEWMHCNGVIGFGRISDNFD